MTNKPLTILKDNGFTPKQLRFARLVEKTYIENGHIDLVEFGKSPFKELKPLELFGIHELERFVRTCNSKSVK